MRSGRIAAIALIIALATASPWGRGGPVRPVPLRGMIFEAYDVYHTTAEFAAREDALAIVRGTPATGYLGLYVYDSQGNCTAMDDLGDYQTRNDLAVQWYVHERETYQIDIVNHSDRDGEFVWVLR